MVEVDTARECLTGAAMNLAAHLLHRSIGPAIGPAIDRARRWPVESQLTARRNAMIAATALAQQRAERDEVDEYLAGSAPVSAATVTGRSAHG